MGWIRLFRTKNDFFIYNALTNHWSKISPLSSLIPIAAKGACIVAKIPKIYIYGEITNSGYSGELWEFDMRSLKYKLISKTWQLLIILLRSLMMQSI